MRLTHYFRSVDARVFQQTQKTTCPPPTDLMCKHYGESSRQTGF